MVGNIRDRKGLSEVVSTLILLVVAVLLASVATYYATNITMTRTETEELQLSKKHVWVNDTGAIAAFKIQMDDIVLPVPWLPAKQIDLPSI